MKILQVLPSLHLGGVERGVIDLARALKKAGHEAVVISSGGELVTELERMGIKHYTMPVHKKSLFTLGLAGPMAQIIERERIDLVHARSRVPAWVAWLAARRSGRPFVTTCHGYYSTHLLSRVMGWGKRVIAISNVVARHMIDGFGVMPERVRLVHRGVDLTQFPQAAKKDEKSRVFRVINVGRLSPIKGQAEFLHAVHEARKRLPALEVLLVGSEQKGKRKYTDLLQQTIQQLHLENCVKMLGTRRDVAELIGQSDCLVLSTLVPEAFGRVVAEAGAVGTPVISTRVGGVMDIVDEGKSGLLVSPGDVSGMADAIVKLATDRALGKQLAENLRRKVQSEFTLEKMTRETLEVYRETIAEKKILVIKLGAMGDVILSIPSLRMLRKRFPGAKISILVDKRFAPLASPVPYVDEVLPVDRTKLSDLDYLFKTARRLRSEGFDVSVDLQNSKWTHLLAFLGGVPERYGFQRGFWGFLLNRPDKTSEVPASPVKHQFRILSKFGIRECDETLELWADEASEEKASQLLPPSSSKTVGFVVGSSPRWQTKRWPIENFQELAKKLTKEGARIVLLGSEEDAGWVKGTELVKMEGVTDLTGKTSLGELIALVKKMDLVVTGDTAPLHVAAASKAGILAFFGPTDPKRHMPPAPSAIVLKKNLSCQPCYEGACRNAEKLACLKQITVEEAYKAARTLLSRRKVEETALAGEP